MRILFSFILFIFFYLPSFLVAQNLERLEVEPIEERDLVLDTLTLEYGRPWDGAQSKFAQNLLESTNRYESISINFTDEGVLQIQLEKKEYFEEIVWQQDEPPKSSEVRRRCFSEREAVRLSESRINQISQCVGEAARREGFLDAQVYLEADGTSRLLVHLDLGKVYVLREIAFSGNDALSDRFLRSQIENKLGRAFKAFQVEEDRDRIWRSYLKEGYYLSRVNAANIEVRPSDRSVRISWVIEEDKKTEFVFKGDSVPDRLTRSLQDLDEIPPEWFIDELLSDIRDHFIEQGYLSVSIEKDIREMGPDLQRVSVKVNKGRQYWLTEPQWIGLNDVPTISKIYSKVARLRPGRFFSEEIFNEKFELEFFQRLVENGFQDVRVRSIEFSIDHEKALVTPIIYMNEGRQYRIAGVQFLGLPEVAESWVEVDDLKEVVELGDVFNAIEVDAFQNELLVALRNRGFLDAEITRELSEIDGRYEVRFKIEAGPRYRVSRILIRGLDRTRVSVIRDEILIDESSYYSRDLMDDTVGQILRLGIARSVDFRILSKNEETAEVLLALEVFEAARFRFEIGPGYGTNDGIRGVFRATYANIGGAGRRLTLYSKASRELEKSVTPDPLDFKDGDVESVPFIERRATLEYFEPSFLGTGIDGRVALSHRKEERRDFSLLSNAASFVLDARLDRHWTLSPEYKIEYSNPFNVVLASETQRIDDAGSSRFNSVGFQVFGSYLDDLFSPQRGLRSSFRFDVYDELLGGNLNFWIATMKQDFFYPLVQLKKSRSVGLALSLNAGFSDSYSDTPEVPVEKRFRVGGESSVRGFSEDAIQPLNELGEPLRNGGASTFFFRSELNIPIFSSFDLLGFFDGGNIYKTNSAFDPTDLRLGAGTGFRFNTPVGPLKFGYAFVLNRKPGESAGQIYFGVGPI